MINLTKFTALAAIAGLMAGTASAYTGPGLGMATITVVLGFFASIFIALFAIVWYPIKRVLKRRKSATPETDAEVSESARDASSGTD